MKRSLFYIVMAALVASVAVCVWYVLRPSVKEETRDSPAKVTRAEPRPNVSARHEKKAAETAKKITAATKGLTAQQEKKIADVAAQQESPGQLAKDDVIARVQSWEKLVDDVLREDNTMPLPERGKKLKAALKEVPDTEKDTGVHTLLNLLPDESFAMVEPILLDPTENPDVLDAIFSDMLNRPDELKNPYIIKISKMRDHPEFTDAMHIKTVTELKEDSGAANQKEEETGNNE